MIIWSDLVQFGPKFDILIDGERSILMNGLTDFVIRASITGSGGKTDSLNDGVVVTDSLSSSALLKQSMDDERVDGAFNELPPRVDGGV